MMPKFKNIQRLKFGFGCKFARGSETPYIDKYIAVNIHDQDSPLSGSLHNHSTYTCCSNRQSTHYGNTHKPFFCDLVIDQTPQTPCLQVCGLMVEQQVIVSSSFRIIPELVVPQR